MGARTGMRIAYLLTSVGMGGAERLALAIARRMAARGHAVQTIALRRLPEEWDAELPVVHLDLRKTPWSGVAGLARVSRVFESFQPDLIHSHGFHANMLARVLRLQNTLLGRRQGADARPALITTVHNVYEGGWPRMMAYRLTDRLSARTTAVSEAAARRFVETGAISRRRCVVLPNAIEMEEYAPDPRRREAVRASMAAGENFIWLAAGRIAPAKDYPNLLRAFAEVCRAMPRSQLWIAGEDCSGAIDPLRKLAGELAISDFIRWLGLRRDLPALLDAADGFVSGSAWEGMPLAVAEAMAMEKPVAATDVGGVRELVGEAGWMAPACNPEALAQAMIAIMRQSRPERETMGGAARARVQARFSMEARAEDWEALYRQVIAERA